jgi:hypothetical protein
MMQKGRTLKGLTFNQGRVTKTGKMMPLNLWSHIAVARTLTTNNNMGQLRLRNLS